MSGTDLSALRQSDRRWIIHVIAAPNMKHLGQRDRRLFGDITSFEVLQTTIEEFAAALGVEVRVFVSDFEGEILERVHRSAATADAYIVAPGGLATVSQGWPHALLETRKPVVEVTFYKPVANGEVSVFTKTAIGRVMGARAFLYGCPAGAGPGARRPHFPASARPGIGDQAQGRHAVLFQVGLSNAGRSATQSRCRLNSVDRGRPCDGSVPVTDRGAST